MVVTIIHGVGSEQTQTEVALPAIPRVGDEMYLENFKVGEVKSVEWQLAEEDTGRPLRCPQVIVRLR